MIEKYNKIYKYDSLMLRRYRLCTTYPPLSAYGLKLFIFAACVS